MAADLTGPGHEQERQAGHRRIRRTVDAVWRMEAPRLIGALTRWVRDVGLAEELAQEALVSALEQWPRDGVPDNPGAWLSSVAKRRAVDVLRRRTLAERKHEDLAREALVGGEEPGAAPGWDEALDDPVGDDLLRLMFVSCHPVLSKEAQTALTLRLLGGLTTQEIARGFLVPEPTVAQRIVRAKRTLSEACVPFEVPRGDDLQARLSTVLEVIYLIFNEGYAATAGSDWTRPELCDEALRLGRILAARMTQSPEVFGLLSLMELQASRLGARVGPDGAPVLLLEQNRARWDWLQIHRGLEALDHARALAASDGPYVLQAALAACHARARTPEQTDWQEIARLYDALAQRTPSPVVELNRAVAHGMAHGPEAGLARVEALADEPALKGYHLVPAVRGDLLEKLGRTAEAAAAFEQAAKLTKNERERQVLLGRAARAAGS